MEGRQINLCQSISADKRVKGSAIVNKNTSIVGQNMLN